MEIANEDLKRAVLNAEIKHADVVLRVLARIDGDREFRDAMVAAVMTKDPTAISTLVYGHFQPIETHGPDGRPKGPSLPKLAAPVSARELATLLNDQAVLIASQMLAAGALEQAVERWVSRRITPALDAIFGIEDDGWNRVRIKQDRDSSPVQRAIRVRAEQAAEPAVKQALDAIDLSALVEKLVVKAHQEMKNAYEHAANDYIRNRAKAWAEERARLDLDRLLAEAETQLKGDE